MARIRRRGDVGWRRPSRAGTLTGLKSLLIALFVLVVAVGGNAYLERVRRTAETPAEILSVDTHPSPGKGARGGVYVFYRFAVAGEAFEYIAFRSWSLDMDIQAKVCYEPGNPRNQSLVALDETCG